MSKQTKTANQHQCGKTTNAAIDADVSHIFSGSSTPFPGILFSNFRDVPDVYQIVKIAGPPPARSKLLRGPNFLQLLQPRDQIFQPLHHLARGYLSRWLRGHNFMQIIEVADQSFFLPPPAINDHHGTSYEWLARPYLNPQVTVPRYPVSVGDAVPPPVYVPALTFAWYSIKPPVFAPTSL